MLTFRRQDAPRMLRPKALYRVANPDAIRQKRDNPDLADLVWLAVIPFQGDGLGFGKQLRSESRGRSWNTKLLQPRFDLVENHLTRQTVQSASNSYLCMQPW